MPLNLPAPKGSTLASANGSKPQSATLNGQNGAEEQQGRPFAAKEETATPSASLVSASLPVTSSFTSKLGLPPPKTKAKQAASNQPKKFHLDLPKPSNGSITDDTPEQAALEDEIEPEGPARKRARIGGLGSMLPPPKNAPTSSSGMKLPPARANGVDSSKATASSTSLLPHKLQNKAKQPADSASAGTCSALTPPIAESPKEQAQEAEEEQEEAAEAVLDFFGLGSAGKDDDEEEEDESTTTMDFFGLIGSAVPIASTSKPSVISAPASVKAKHTASAAPAFISTSVKKVSAAPTTAAPDLANNYYATLPVPTPNDPYPGFYQKLDGSWGAKRPDEWEIWSNAAQAWGKEAEEEEEEAKKGPTMPADFAADLANQSLEVRAANLRNLIGGNDESRAAKIKEEDRKRMEQEQQKSTAKKFSHNARSRHQLSTLVQDAQLNRQELEDRIAQMKTNKRSGGSKYGF